MGDVLDRRGNVKIFIIKAFHKGFMGYFDSI